MSCPDEALADEHDPVMERYYRLQSRIYDWTRWAFLFGRDEVVRKLAAVARPRSVLEVGCGTGTNLLHLSRRFPQARLTGVDASVDMLRLARRRLASLGGRARLLHRAYDGPVSPERPFDVVLFSYSLTMMNPGWDRAIDWALDDLADEGVLAVADFHDSPWRLFKRWMRLNHVRVDGHVLPELRARFEPRQCHVRSACLGLWSYLTFIGSKPR